jgi:L-ascorbate metabolism protein UlaG (beta-lactamase superfamily)
MQISWLGYRGVRIEGDDVTLVIDPDVSAIQDGSKEIGNAKVVALSVRPNDASPLQLAGDSFLIDGPGEYEIHGAFIVAVQTEAPEQVANMATGNDTHGAAKVKTMNTVFAIELDDLTICHLGALGHKLDRQQVEAIGKVDVLIVPVGGVDALGPGLAAEVVGQLDPAIVVPVNHAMGDSAGRGLAEVQKFVEEIGVIPGEIETSLTISTNRIPDDIQLHLLSVSEA